jgi:uncharacterized protein (DUF433 family)
MKPNEYVEQRGDGWHVRDSRVSLDSLIFAFRDGLSPEAIARECFPTLRLEQVYGAIAFYLAHRAELDALVESSVAQGDAWRREQRTRDAAFSGKMAEARRELLAGRS